MRILLSWYAFNNDFKDGAVSEQSPTVLFHENFFKYDKHIILSSEKEDDTRLQLLVSHLVKKFPERKQIITPCYLQIKDIIDFVEIKQKIEALLLEHSEDEIDIFFSPGTSAMQVAWYVCHTTLNLKTRLLQTRPPKFNKGKPELIEINVEMSSVPVTAVLLTQALGRGSRTTEDYNITTSLRHVYDRANKIAQTDSVACLINGATGTGKEYLARYIHKQSSRVSGPFIAVNCSALSENLLESRLFGYKKGSFTGADKDTKGLFEVADGGTIFLDEIGDISSYMQQALLRVLQEKEITPIGDYKSRKINVRVIAATHRALREMCSEDNFRWDLFYRLSVAELRLPSLAERGLDEKREMIQYFLRTKQKSLKRIHQLKIHPEAMKVLDSYQFPGNIRELENLIESLYVFYDKEVKVGDLPEWLNNTKDVESTFNWEQHERALIKRAITFFKGNKNKTCKALGYKSNNTLQKKLEEYDIKLQ